MKITWILGLTLLSSVLPTAAFARSPMQRPMCQKVAEEAAAKADKKMFNAEAGSCGSKVLHLGNLETYLVCVSDETDPSEWIVVVDKVVSDKKAPKGLKFCVVRYTGYAVDATPDFDK